MADSPKVTLEALEAQIAALKAKVKVMRDGLPTGDEDVRKFASSIDNLSVKMGIEPLKVMKAIGFNMKSSLNLSHRKQQVPGTRKARKAK